jgi:hypothetical protein
MMDMGCVELQFKFIVTITKQHCCGSHGSFIPWRDDFPLPRILGPAKHFVGWIPDFRASNNISAMSNKYVVMFVSENDLIK